MQKSTKKYLKTNLIGFILGCFLISWVAVYAVIVFPSNEVSYENSISGLKSTDVQGAIDELYTECTKVPSSGEQILDKVDVVTSGDGLYKDEYECRYIYRGAQPNNYIVFNNQLWRIISVECDGTIKIVSTETLGKMAWDTSDSNNWVRPATLNTYLNSTYYNSLTSTAQNQIATHSFSIGGADNYNNDLAGQINDENATKWTGKIALVTASEFVRTNTDKNCMTHYALHYGCSNSYRTTWMVYRYDGAYGWWSLTKNTYGYNQTTYVFYLNSHGGTYSAIDGTSTSAFADNANNYVIPALYLKSDLKITGGNGSQSNPYTIE